MNILLFLALLATCCGYSIVFGGGPERTAAGILLAAVAATATVGQLHFRQFSGPEIGILLVDFATFTALMVLAVRADRFWPMAVAACVGVGLMAHASILLAPGIVPSVYATLHAFSAYPTLLILAAGTYRHRKRLKMTGIERSWSTSSA